MFQHFVRKEEKKIEDYLVSIAGPYDSMIRDALLEYGNSLGRLDISDSRDDERTVKLPEMGAVRRASGIVLPAAAAHMRYSARIRTEAAARLGFYTVVKLFKKIMKKPLENEKEEKLFALKDGVQRMKKETIRSVIFNFKDYKENIKFQYLFKLADSASNNLYEALLDRFQAYLTDLSTIVQLISEKKADKQKAAKPKLQ